MTENDKLRADVEDTLHRSRIMGEKLDRAIEKEPLTPEEIVARGEARYLRTTGGRLKKRLLHAQRMKCQPKRKKRK